MLINQSTMDELHNIQYEMFLELLKVLKKLNIDYFFIHGSLLGAIVNNDFIPEDDDIDIAIKRKDYDLLMKVGNDMLPNNLFLQNSLNDDFPLAFGKLRNSNTAFVQPVLDKYKCNKGIYIDIFPIDSVPSSNTSLKFKLLTRRINSRLNYEDGNIIKKIKLYCVNFLSILLFPSYLKAVKKRENIFNLSKGDEVQITGGKISENALNSLWFVETTEVKFRDINVKCPKYYDAYLKHIYGNEYLTYNPANGRLNGDEILISASILDFEKTYREFSS